MMTASLLSILFSSALLVVLGTSDPKRLRNLGHSASKRAPTIPAGLRRSLGWLSLAPGVVLGFLGEWWAFLIWFGAIGAVGWTVAQVLSFQAPRERQHS